MSIKFIYLTSVPPSWILTKAGNSKRDAVSVQLEWLLFHHTCSDFCLACLLGHLSPVFVMFPSLDILQDMITSNTSSREIS